MLLDMMRRVAPAVLRRDFDLTVSKTPLLTVCLRSISSTSAVCNSSENSDLAPQSSPMRSTRSESNRRWNFMRDTTEMVLRNSTELTPEEQWQEWEKTKVARLEAPHNAYSGRSVKVIRGPGVMAALAKLNSICRVNKVRQEYMAQQRHEKKGDQRRRLQSERWRKRFAHEVRKKIKLANEIRARGS